MFADLDKNGFLNFAEYVKAMNASSEEISEQPVLPIDVENNEI